jgi:hypothetical protein
MLRVTAEWPALLLRRPGGDTGELKSRDLLRRFWNSAAGFWGQYGTPVSWFLSGALLFIVLLNLAASYGMNVWASRHFRCAAGQRFKHGSAAVHALRAASGGKRLLERHADLRAHDDAAAMARMAQ